MSFGSIIGGVVGGVIGFFVGGPTGAYYGAVLGFGIGMAIDPIMPDMPNPGIPDPGVQVMTATIGDPVADLCGTAKITGHLLCFGKERNEKIYAESAGGKGGGEPDPQVTGYKYYMSWALGICAGPVDTIYAIYKNDDAEAIWEGVLDCPVSGGQETIVLDGIGSCTFYFGTNDQVANSTVGEIISDDTLNTPYRNLCWCFFDDCYIGEYNRTPTYKFLIKKIPQNAFSADKHTIQIYDTNPAHALWYIFNSLAGLPEAWLNSTDFSAVADTLSDEYRGVCVLLDRQQSVLSYVEAINGHIDNIIRYGSDGKFHPKLIRDDYTVGSLLSVDESVMLDDPAFNRRSWIDTINEMKVQYSEIINVRRIAPSALPPGRWVAALSQRNTPYIYVYNIEHYSILKIDTTEDTPVVVDMLVVNDANYVLDYDKGYGSTPGAQRGSYCISKDYNKIWYLFKDTSTGDIKLVEIDISGSAMSIINTSTHSAIMDYASSEYINDACGDDDYVFFCTSVISGRILRFDTSHTLLDKEFNYAATGAGDEAIHSIDLNTSLNEICWVYARAVPFMTCKCPYASYNFTVRWTFSETDSGVDNASWQNFLRYDEIADTIFRQRAYNPLNGVAYYYSQWDQNIGRAYVQYLMYMQSYLGGNATYFYVLHLSTSATSKLLHRFTHQDSTLGGALVESSVEVISYLDRFSANSSTSVYNEETNKSFLVSYNSSTEVNYIASFNQSLSLVSDEFFDTIYWE